MASIFNPNLIKQPAQCCIHCGKSYKKRSNLDKHSILCELLQQSKKGKKIIEDDEIDLPSQRKMFTMLLELGKKFNTLEEKVDELNKWVVKRKKRINVVEWLNTNLTSTIKFENLIDKILVTEDDVQYLMTNSFLDTLNRIFSRSLYNLNEGETPIVAFIEKSNIFYVYDTNMWTELDKKNLVKFLDNVHVKINRHYTSWKRQNKDEIEKDETLSTIILKTNLKIMSVEFEQESFLGKVRTAMYNKLKKQMKGILEYEFDF